MSPIARLRSVAMMRGRGPVRTREQSSRNVTWRTDPVDLVLYGPVTADVPGDVLRGGLAGVQAGDDEHRDRGLHLLAYPALSLPDPDGAGDVPFDQGDLAGVREPPRDVRGGVHDLDGAPLAATVAFLLRRVLDGDGGPVQGVDLVP